MLYVAFVRFRFIAVDPVRYCALVAADAASDEGAQNARMSCTRLLKGCVLNPKMFTSDVYMCCHHLRICVCVYICMLFREDRAWDEPHDHHMCVGIIMRAVSVT